MRRLLLLLFLFLYINAKGQQTYLFSNNTYVDSIYPTMPQRNVEISDKEIKVTYIFTGFNLLNNPYITTSSIINIDGFGKYTALGDPMIPIRWDTFLIEGDNYSVNLIDSSFVDFNIELSPTPNIPSCGHNSTKTIDFPKLTDRKGFYPISILSSKELDYRSNPLLSIGVSPIKYDANQQKVRFYKKIVYSITFQSSNVINRLSNLQEAELDPVLNNLVINRKKSQNSLFSQSQLTPFSADITKDYLIITTPKFLDAVSEFAEWKRNIGFRTKVISNNNWTKEKVKDSIESYYFATNKKLQYLLIVGGIDDVPNDTIIDYKEDTDTDSCYVTDYYYGCMPNKGIEDKIQDIACGRIPVNKNEEAKNVFKKIIEYEKNPIIDDSFYNTGLMMGVFQTDEDNDWPTNMEIPRAIQTNEDIRNMLLSGGYNVNRIYTVDKRVSPKKWSTLYSNGGYMPDSLMKSKNNPFKWFNLFNPNYFPTNTNFAISDNVIKRINNGTLFAHYIGHGEVERMLSVIFRKCDIDSLCNLKKLPVFFSMCCRTGRFSDPVGCFAESFLKKKNAGCVAIFAATGNAPFGSTECLSLGMFNAIWPELKIMPDFANTSEIDFSVTPTYRLGQILQQGYNKLSEFNYTYKNSDNDFKTKEIFHCFGDPSMRMYTKQPTYFENVTVNRTDSTVGVILPELAEITFYNKTTGETKSYLSKNYKYSGISSNIDVYITGHNKIPYIDYSDKTFIQNETVQDELIVNNDSVIIGSEVTSSKKTGPVVFKNGSAIKINAQEVEIYGDTTIELGAELEINTNENQ